MLSIILIGVLLFILRGIYLGFSKKAVFYMDKEDMFISLSPIIVLFLGFLLAIVTDWMWIMYLVWILVITLIFYIIFSAYHYNKDNFWIGISVGLAKIALSGTVVLYAYKSYNDIDDHAISSREYGFTLLILGALSALLPKLINGQEVYLRNGWNFDMTALERLGLVEDSSIETESIDEKEKW